jgi:hypothetical protein
MINKRIVLTGRDLAVITGALHMAQFWPFREAIAVAFLRQFDRTSFAEPAERISSEFLRILQDAKLSEGQWTADYVRSRAGATGKILISDIQSRLIIVSLKMCAAEFSSKGGWIDFCVAAPGDIGAYGAGPDDLVRLAEFLTGAGEKG